MFNCPNCGLSFPLEPEEYPVTCACGLRQESVDAQPVWPSRSRRAAKNKKMPSLVQRGWNLAKAIARHKAAGSPERPEPKRLFILENHCRPCDYYRPDESKNGEPSETGACAVCGCPLTAKKALVNKLFMATESCPMGYWSADLLGGFQLVDKPRRVGQGLHRDGWPWVVEQLAEASTDGAILFDDFVEQTFSYERKAAGYDQPWAGIFHHPPTMPTMYRGRGSLIGILNSEKFSASRPHLKLAIAMSNHLADFLALELGVPTAVVRYPQPQPKKQWSPRAYSRSGDRLLVQLGWYLRNTRAIHQVDAPGHRKIWPVPTVGWIRSWDRLLEDYWQGEGSRQDRGEVENPPLFSADVYDLTLKDNVVLIELLAASANTVLVECIARATPVIVNRHPAAVEYLGPNYPLFFDDIREVESLLELDRVLAAHDYLASMDRSWLDPAFFIESIQQSLNKEVS